MNLPSLLAELAFFNYIQVYQISNIELWIYRVAIGVCFILIFFIIQGRKNSRKLESNKSKTIQPNDPYVNLKPKVDELWRKVHDLEVKVSRVQSEKRISEPVEIAHVNKNWNEKAGNKAPVSEVQEEIPSKEIELPLERGNDNQKEETEKRIFYLSPPDKEKIFFAPEATLVPNDKTLYTVEDDQLKLYEHIENQTMRLAFNSLDIFVKRVCDILNAREPQHSKIVMVEPGRVIKEEDDFLVLNKIKVKFE